MCVCIYFSILFMLMSACTQFHSCVYLSGNNSEITDLNIDFVFSKYLHCFEFYLFCVCVCVCVLVHMQPLGCLISWRGALQALPSFEYLSPFSGRAQKSNIHFHPAKFTRWTALISFPHPFAFLTFTFDMKVKCFDETAFALLRSKRYFRLWLRSVMFGFN